MGRGTYLGLDGLVTVEVVRHHAAPVEASTARIAAEPMAFPVHVPMQLQALLVGTIPSTHCMYHQFRQRPDLRTVQDHPPLEREDGGG